MEFGVHAALFEKHLPKARGAGRTLAPGPTCEGAIYDTLRKDNEKRSAEWARVKAHLPVVCRANRRIAFTPSSL